MWYTTGMDALGTPYHLLNFATVIAIMVIYYRGAQRFMMCWPSVYSGKQLCLFFVGVTLLFIAMSPLFTIAASHYISVRSVQKVLLSMVIPPLLWVGMPFHCLLFALPAKLRGVVVRNVIQRSNGRSLLKVATRPSLAWLIYIGIFLLWHEPAFASWIVEHQWANSVFAWVLLTVSILFWSQVMLTAPRIHRPQPGWILFIMLVAVEIPNMVAGVTVAFASEPIYSHYVSLQEVQIENGAQLWLTTIADQRLSGCITWIAGTLVYISAIIMVLNRLFEQENGLPPLLSFTDAADERTIAPGLEYRVYKNHWGQIEAESNPK